MAKTLTIAGVNLLPRLKSSSARIREQLEGKSNEMNATFAFKAGQAVFGEGSEIIYKDDSRFLFAGYITNMKPQEYGTGKFLIYDVECTDYTYIFNNKIARRTYQNRTLNYIVLDLVGEYVAAGYGINTTNVATGPTLATISFDHITLRQCFEKLSKRTGYVWYVDYQKNLYFQTKTAVAAPTTFVDGGSNYSEVTIAYDATQVRNSVIVIGSSEGEESATLATQTFIGDGNTRSWELEDKPSTVASIKVNGVAKAFSLDVNEKDADVFVYSYSGQSFKTTEGTPVYTVSDTIVIQYYPRVPIIIKRQSAPSIAELVLLEGGDGVHEHTIKDASILSKSEAYARADQELEEYGYALVTGTVQTRSGLLGGSLFVPGQYLNVTFPSYGINTSTAFLIQEVLTSLTEDETTSVTQYFYEIRFGGKRVSFERILESLTSPKEDVADVDKVLTIEQLTDRVGMTHNTATILKQTPPFKYGPAGSPQARWNLSEWA